MGADVRAGGLTASFRIRYVHGPEADRIAANQARAVAALLRWLATQNSTRTTTFVPTIVDLDVPDWDVNDEKAA
ncbi:hypothetical protein [Nocardia lijiangensis]|uniref:hypothetical protein n=1 Tax=Nocardia lijiangensis TaxID=299618 RepID=UPI003D739123